MKSKIKFGRNIIAVLLCILISVSSAVPAFAMELEEDEITVYGDDAPVELPDRVTTAVHAIHALINRIDANEKQARLNAKKWTTIASNYFGTAMSVVKNISSIISLINGTRTLLMNLGVLENETDMTQSIIEGINSIRMAVNEIDKNVDEIQETLINEFSELDLKFQEQEYNHYKDDVWARFYSDAVVPLVTYQNEYNDDVNRLLMDYIEQWQGDENGECPMGLRALYGEDGNGGFIQVYSGKNLGEVGEKLPREPKGSVDSVPVAYSLTLPSKYIGANFDSVTSLTSKNCFDLLIEALEKGIYQAAENKELEAYGGFDTVWSYLTEEEKRETAKEFAEDLADSLAFTCAYNAANERRFASDVKSAYENFVKWVQGEESLTSPAYAQLKMLALTHGFEGEIKTQADTVAAYLMLMGTNFATFTQTVVLLSKAHGEDDCEEIKSQWIKSETSILNDFSSFLTGNPNYCYQLNKSVEYRNTAVSSELSFAYGRNGVLVNPETDVQKYKEYCTSTPWIIYEKDAMYSDNKDTASEQKSASGNFIKSNTISSKDAKLIYAMYKSSKSTDSFAEYLASNKVATNAESVADKIITSFETGTFDLNKGIEMKCYLPTGHASSYVKDGMTYAVSTGISDDLASDYYLVKDNAKGSLFNTKNGSVNENAIIAARAFYGEEKWTNIDEMDVFSTVPVSFKSTLLSDKEVENLKIDPGLNERLMVDCSFSADYGSLVSTELNTYTFPANTEKVADKYFGNEIKFDSIVFKGIPEEIADNAFKGVGTQAKRCLLTVPAGFETGSLEGEWHGGYFGNTKITVSKNDGSNEEKKVVAVNGAPLSTVVNPFEAPEHRTFAGWSYSEHTGEVADISDPVMAGLTLYAVWKYDHEHEFEISKEAVTATCTENGATAERTCKICGCKEYSVSIPAFGHSCVFEKRDDGNYSAVCTECTYSTILYPKDCNTFTVWCENNQSSDVTFINDKYNGNSVSINKSGVYVVENNNKNSATPERISVNDGVKASIGLAGVNIAPPQRVPALNSGNGTVHITLVDGTENRLTGGGDCPALQTGGNLIVDGGGSLIAVAAVKSAVKTSGLNTVFKSGRIYADGGEYYGIEAAGAQNNFVISKEACVYSSNGLNAVPVNENGENVYLLCIENEENKIITVDGEELPYTSSPCDNNAYVFLTDEEHEITLGGESFDGEFIDGHYYFEKEFGDFTVKYTNLNAFDYEDGVLTVKSSDPVIIKNTKPQEATTDRILVKRGVCANITLNGVNIVEDDCVSPLKIEEYVSGDVRITLAEGSENTLVGGSGCAGISKNGKYGTLTIDGKGTLNATGGFDSAAIGSDNGKTVHGIIINDGVINATVNSYRAAAIGSGCVDADSAPSGEKVYTAEGIIINGGTINARSKDSAAIGGGDNDSVAGKTFAVKDIIINGGTVNAKSENAQYSIGAGVYTAAENIRINGGIVTAEATGVTGMSAGSGGDRKIGGIGANLGTDNLVIEKDASVKAGFEPESPVNGEGCRVYLNEIPTGGNDRITIDGKLFPYSSHNGEKKVYVYLPKDSEIKKVYSFVIEESERGTVTANTEAPATGDEVKLYATVNEGYVFKGFEVTPMVELDDDTFIMPDWSVTARGIFSHIGTVTIKDCENCTVTPSKSIAETGEKITLRIVPDEGMKLSEWVVETENAEITNNTFTMPDEDVVISCVCVPKAHTLTWNVDGEKNTQTLDFGSEINPPENPVKEGCTFEGWYPEVAQTMPDEDVEYVAVFTPDTYYATFVAGGKTVAKIPYSVEDFSIDEPYCPDKTGYVSSWEEYTLVPGGVTVNAEYTPEIYKAKFVADGKIVEEIPYTVETLSIDAPVIPSKDGYTAKWSEYTLVAGGITVNAVYTATVHEHTFATKYSYNDTMHWYASTCGHDDIAKGLGEHTFGDGIVAGNSTIYICTECSYVKIVSNEIVELKEKAIAEIEAAAGTERSEAMESAVELAELAVERATTAEEIESAKESGLAVIKASQFAIGNCTVNGSILYMKAPVLTTENFYENYVINKDASVQVTPLAESIIGTGSKVQATYFNSWTDEYTIVIPGDLNGDGVCDVIDATLAESAAKKHTVATDIQIYAANGCAGDEIDITSYQNVVNMSLK